MLENVKNNDICVFSSGERAVVEAIFNHNAYIRLWFDRPVKLQITDSLADKFFDYWYDGVLAGVSNPNNIVKVIPC